MSKVLRQSLLVIFFLGVSALAEWQAVLQDEPQVPILHYVAWNPNDDTLVSSNTISSGSVTASTQAVETLPLAENVYDVVFSPDGQHLAMGKGSVLLILDVKTNTVLYEVPAHQTAILTISWSPNGSQLVTASYSPEAGDQEIKIWNAEPLEPVFSYYAGSIWQLAWSPTASQIAMKSVTGAGVYVLDVEKSIQSQREEVQFIGTQPYATPHGGAVAWNMSGTMVATGLDDSTIGLFDIATGQQVASFSGPKEATTALAFSPDDKFLASASNDGTIRVHNLETRELVAEYAKGERVRPRRMAFSPFGGRLAFGSDVLPAQLRPGELYIEQLNTVVVTPIVSVERLKEVAANCNTEQTAAILATLNVDGLTSAALPPFIDAVKALPNESLPAPCRADLLAVAEAVAAAP